jgi:hypothetical protein
MTVIKNGTQHFTWRQHFFVAVSVTKGRGDLRSLKIQERKRGAKGMKKDTNGTK